MSSSSSQPTRIRQVAPPPHGFEAVAARRPVPPPKKGGANIPPCAGGATTCGGDRIWMGRRACATGGTLWRGCCPTCAHRTISQTTSKCTCGTPAALSSSLRSTTRCSGMHARTRRRARIARCTRCLVPSADNVPRRRSCGAVRTCVRGAGGDGHRERPPTISSNKMTKADPRDLFAKHSNTVLYSWAEPAQPTRAARARHAQAHSARVHTHADVHAQIGARRPAQPQPAHARSIRAG
jgi:hypothetical protein